MRFAKFFLISVAFLLFASNLRADEIRVTAVAVFQQPNAGLSPQFIFSSTFLFDLGTDQLVPGSMSTHVTDGFSGTPYTDWVPKPNFHGPTFTYLDPDLDEVQILFAQSAPSEIFPTLGSYPFTDMAVTCVTFACAEHFGPDVLVPVAGELTVAAVPEPEPSTGIFVVFGMALAFLQVGRAKLLHA
jgi:hypothetical protein